MRHGAVVILALSVLALTQPVTARAQSAELSLEECFAFEIMSADPSDQSCCHVFSLCIENVALPNINGVEISWGNTTACTAPSAPDGWEASGSPIAAEYESEGPEGIQVGSTVCGFAFSSFSQTTDIEVSLLSFGNVVFTQTLSLTCPDNCSQEAAVPIDIHPGSCPNPLNIGARGVFPIAILGTPELDVADIDRSTLRLEGVPPKTAVFSDVATPFIGAECDCHELGMDGITDLAVKFYLQAVVAALGPVTDGEVLELTVTGALNDGTPFSGADCVRIIANAVPPVSAESYGEDVELTAAGDPTGGIQRVSYRIDVQSSVRITVYDAGGRRVDELLSTVAQPGFHTVEWDATHYPSGVYFYRLEAGGEVVTSKALLLR